MKTNRFVLSLSLFLIFCIASCAANVEVRKKQEEASRNLGEAYMQQRDFSSALREFLKAEKIYSKDPLLQNDFGLAYMAKGRLDLAVKHFKKAVKLKPDYAPARNNLGTAYLAKKEWDVAIACFKEIVDDVLYATPHYPLTNLGWAYYNKQEYETWGGHITISRNTSLQKNIIAMPLSWNQILLLPCGVLAELIWQWKKLRMPLQFLKKQ